MDCSEDVDDAGGDGGDTDEDVSLCNISSSFNRLFSLCSPSSSFSLTERKPNGLHSSPGIRLTPAITVTQHQMRIK